MAMLVYIALQPDQVESRERIAARLWSDSGARARPRRAAPDAAAADASTSAPAGDLVEADRSAIRLTRPVSLDILEARLEAAAAIAPAPARRARASTSSRHLRRLRGHRPASSTSGSRSSASAWSRSSIGKLEAALAAAPRPRPSGWRFAEALARVDPTHEGACRAAMQAHMALGDTAAGDALLRAALAGARRGPRRRAVGEDPGALRRDQAGPARSRGRCRRLRRRRTCSRRSPSSSSRSRRSTCPAPSATSARSSATR